MFEWHKRRDRSNAKQTAARSWTGIGMSLTFRAEIMPGREASERTYKVSSVLANGRVEIDGMSGEHSEAEFEPTR